MFVGDSLSLNQWQSLVCMIYASVPNAKTSLTRKDPLSSVTFQVLPAVFFFLRTFLTFPRLCFLVSFLYLPLLSMFKIVHTFQTVF